MRCKKIKGLLIGHIKGSLDNRDAKRVDEHLSSCATCRKEAEQMKSLWVKMDNIEHEEPSPNLKKKIDNMILSYASPVDNNFMHESLSEKFSKWLETWWPRRPVIQFVTTSTFLIVGFITGISLGHRGESKNQISQLRSDIDGLEKVVMASILNQSSVSDRINGLTMSSQLKDVDAQFLSMLLLLLNTDSDVNVRLASVNALANFTDNEYVRNQLVKSLGLQSSPLVQVSLIDLLADIKEYNSSSALMKIINDPNVNAQVKKRAETALKQLI